MTTEKVWFSRNTVTVYYLYSGCRALVNVDIDDLDDDLDDDLIKRLIHRKDECGVVVKG